MDNQIKGYRLHLKRILYSGGTITRSIKFLLSSTNEKQKKQVENFCQKLYSDDLKVRGIINLNDINLSFKEESYDLAEYWIDSLKAGVIWQPNSLSLINLVKKIYRLETTAERIYSLAKNEVKEYFDKEKFIQEIILSTPKRSTSKKSAFYNTLWNLLKPDFKKEEQRVKKITNHQAELLIQKIINSFYDPSGNFILEGEENQNKFWREALNIDKTLLKKERIILKEMGDITAFIYPPLIHINEKKSLSELIQERLSLFGDNNIQEILGLAENFNAFSHYFNKFFNFLYEEKVDLILNTFQELFFLDDDELRAIKKSLLYLSQKAKKLGKPKLVNSWADYRSVFGGKVQSWFSNYLTRDIKAKEQGEKLREALGNSKKFLEEFKTKNPINNDLLSQIEFYLEKINQLIIRFPHFDFLRQNELFDIFSDFLANLKINLNLFFQKYLKTSESEQKVGDFYPFKNLYIKYEKPITFYGKSKFIENKKIIDFTLPLIKSGIVIIKKIINDLKDSYSVANIPQLEVENNLRKILDYLLKKETLDYFFKKEFGLILNNYLGKDYQKIIVNKERYTFLPNIYVRESKILINLKIDSYHKEITNLINNLCVFLLAFNDDDILKNNYLLLDFIELSKVIISQLILYSNKKEFKTYYEDLNPCFLKALHYLKSFNINSFNSKNDANYFYQTRILSEIKGAAEIFSKRLYKSKYTAQIIKSNEKFPLFLESEINLKKEDLKNENILKEVYKKPHQYYLSLAKIRFKKNINKSKTIHLDKSTKELVTINTNDYENLVKIQSSYYQIQFLDRFIYPVKEWKLTTISLSEWFFVLEKLYEVRWNIETGGPEFREVKSDLYLNIPFEIKAVKKDQTQNTQKKLYLGIDVGEYGVGYCLVDFNDNDFQILKQGFIRSYNIASIKDKFKELQMRAKRGIFSAPTNVLKAVRDNAIGEIRNQIHDVLTKTNANIVYEYSITNFETGSGRVTKIYDSIKKSDVSADNEADKTVIKNIWGINYPVGFHLSAYASSYTCSCCGRSLYQLTDFDINSAKIIDRRGNILTIETPKAQIYAYSKDKKYIAGYRFDQQKKSKKRNEIFINLIKDYARPPLLKSEVLLTQKKISKEFLLNLKKNRGNSAVFVCPFVDCNIIADADIQAAFMMALRGYLRYQLFKKEINYLDESLNYLKKVNKKINFFNLPFEIDR